MKTSVCVIPAIRDRKDELRKAAKFADTNKLQRFTSASGLLLKRDGNTFEVFKCENTRKRIGDLGFRLVKSEKHVGKVIVLS